VPADSADCIAHIVDNGIELYEDFVLKGDVRISVINERHTYTKATTLKDGDSWLDEPYPCWSVGRLIEIYEIVGENAGQCVTTTKGTSRIESLVQLYEENATLLDFSKLEAV
jgi:hypothetical protein